MHFWSNQNLRWDLSGSDSSLNLSRSNITEITFSAVNFLNTLIVNTCFSLYLYSFPFHNSPSLLDLSLSIIIRFYHLYQYSFSTFCITFFGDALSPPLFSTGIYSHVVEFSSATPASASIYSATTGSSTIIKSVATSIWSALHSHSLFYLVSFYERFLMGKIFLMWPCFSHPWNRRNLSGKVSRSGGVLLCLLKLDFNDEALQWSDSFLRDDEILCSPSVLAKTAATSHSCFNSRGWGVPTRVCAVFFPKKEIG